jgi:hypothetical protein
MRKSKSEDAMNGNRDFRDLLLCLNEGGVRYLIVGAYAVIYHTEPRYTKDLDIWVEPTAENAAKVWRALASFGAPLDDLSVADLSNPDMIYQIGVEPNRIDLIMEIKGLSFTEAWKNRVITSYDDQPVSLLSWEHILLAKKAAGRPRDLLDVEILEANGKRKLKK